uniref:Acyl-CoA dehydrogenase AFT10-1 n=1 Tax=Alternaria alternata TaxID=5599 RepID=AF101_ALTAL|nr:RecName: Full=Acyl-CoA dehydrogenase AFT10-1; AltName: Full=AF-toxin biosynthesis protein 10-1 [Alternaria alternata]BAD97695.1 Aft10-1 [Alternaria alternata]
MSYFFGSTVPFAEPLWYSRPENFRYNESHRRLRESVRGYIEAEIMPFCTQWEADGEVPSHVLKRHAALGYAAALINPSAVKEHMHDVRLPGDVPPREWDEFHGLIVADEVARCGSLGVLWALGCGTAIACPILVNYGTEEQKAKFLPPVIHGESRFCLGITEPEVGSDIANLVTRAEQEGNYFIVNGTKKWVTNGTFADYCIAAVRTGQAGRTGISLLNIPLDVAGVSREKIESSGVASGGTASITFDNVQVPVENLLGEKNKGFYMLMSSFDHHRSWIAANCLRLARVCLEDAYQYALTRQTFGKPLINHQTIRLKLANIGIQITSSYALLESLTEMRQNLSVKMGQVHRGIGGLCAITKVAAARTFELAVRESQQIMGASAYTRTGPGLRVERLSRDMRVLVIGGGSEEILSEMSVVQEQKDLNRCKSCP